MIFYFSGTGNSAFAAKKLAGEIGESIVSLNEIIKENKTITIPNERLIFVTPTYAWRIPRVVSDWIEKMDFPAGQQVYFVMTCGGAIANAQKYLKALSEKKHLIYMGCLELVMPENYIAMFGIPTEEESADLIAKAEAVLHSVAAEIMKGRVLGVSKKGFKDNCLSGVVNDIFYPMCVSAKKFYSTQDCIGCSKCVEVCPLNNIVLTDGKPVWGQNCTHCMACICRCPKEAIEYGKNSIGKRRYVCPGE